MGSQVNKIRRNIQKNEQLPGDKDSLVQAMKDYQNAMANQTSDITKQGSLITLETVEGNELAMVLKYITQEELREYVKSKGITIVESDEVWKRNYAVIGHFKCRDVREIVQDSRYNETPVLNHLIVSVNGVDSYTVVIGDAPEFNLMYNAVKDITLADTEHINPLVSELLKMTTMHIMTGALKDEYTKEYSKLYGDQPSQGLQVLGKSIDSTISSTDNG